MNIPPTTSSSTLKNVRFPISIYLWVILLQWDIWRVSIRILTPKSPASMTPNSTNSRLRSKRLNWSFWVSWFSNRAGYWNLIITEISSLRVIICKLTTSIAGTQWQIQSKSRQCRRIWHRGYSSHWCSCRLVLRSGCSLSGQNGLTLNYEIKIVVTKERATEQTLDGCGEGVSLLVVEGNPAEWVDDVHEE